MGREYRGTPPGSVLQRQLVSLDRILCHFASMASFVATPFLVCGCRQDQRDLSSRHLVRPDLCPDTVAGALGLFFWNGVCPHCAGRLREPALAPVSVDCICLIAHAGGARLG